MYFPTICVDNFFDNPLEITKFAQSLDYYSCYDHPNKGLWPGKRSIILDEVNEQFFTSFTLKLFSIFYGLEENFNYKCLSYFQLTEPGTYGDIDTGFIHRDSDGTQYAGVVYLTPDADLECGTSIYKSKNFRWRWPNADAKYELYSNKNFSDEKIKEKIDEHNSDFTETIYFGNVYNRLIAYDASEFHGVKSFNGKNKTPRLTLVFFVEKFLADRYPIPNSKRIRL
jgi:hypothetical protein